jgi:hypothetical protein
MVLAEATAAPCQILFDPDNTLVDRVQALERESDAGASARCF